MKKLIYLVSVFVKLALLCLLGLFPASSYAQQTSFSILSEKAEELGIEESLITRLQERANMNGISEGKLADILEPAVALAEDNLPFDKLLEKTFEGLAKNIPDQVLINVLQRLQKATQQSVGIVDPWLQERSVQRMLERTESEGSSQQFRNNMLNSAGRALSQGIPEESVANFMNELKSDEILSQVNTSEMVTSLNILADLPTSNGNLDISQKLIIRALKGGFGSSDLQKLPSAMQMAQNKGQLPSNSIANGIFEQIQAGSPAAEILQSLFDGKIGGGPPAGVPGRPENLPGRGNSGNGQQ
ncbi:MAG: hypothetical protein WD059_01210 [Balneolaceae bacterium]